MPNSNANFVVETDANDVAVGVVMMKYNWPVTFILKALNFLQCNNHTIDYKLLEIILACKKWHLYLDGKRTIVVIDHKFLT